MRCLILDVRMTGMNGLELWNRLKACGRAIPVIFITAHGNEAQRSKTLLDGAIEYLYKPFSEEALLGAINTALDSELSEK
jgi:FixJ family two-component response regulator